MTSPTTAPIDDQTAALLLRDVASETAAQLRVLAHLPAADLTGETDSFGLYLLLSRLADNLTAAERAYRPAEEAAHDPAEPPQAHTALDAESALALLRGIFSNQGVPS
ncbi:hypothetical protein [uncultured Thiodictyon sp.]|jgi:hypothetical protein|uniref:hypothetical protein n=1 Tax=uncultured Thiodictyon sp. TaxID=1846217 RepID=UPI0025D69308|nr:hypothetical protein [uncultured Thiodictyon sp.]